MMRTGIALMFIILLLSCNNSGNKKSSTLYKNDTLTNQLIDEADSDTVFTKVLRYSEEELLAFLDSIGHLNPEKLAGEIDFIPDSLFKSQVDLDVQLSKNNFALLRQGCSKAGISKELAKLVFPGEQIDSVFIADSIVPVTCYQFGKNDFTYYAIELYNWELPITISFFTGNCLVAKHKVYNKYGVEISSFIPNDGLPVIYYKQNFASGSGIWWFNYNFYKFSEEQLFPVLNTLAESNIQAPRDSRTFWLETVIEKTIPLTIKATYYDELLDYSLPDTSVRIVDESITTQYNWTPEEKKYIMSNPLINKYKLLSHYLEDNDLLFINTYYSLLKKMIVDNNDIHRQITFSYLNDVKLYMDERN